MRVLLWLSIWLRRIVLLTVLFALGVGAPIAYSEATCAAPAPARAGQTAFAPAARAYAELPSVVAARAELGYAAAVAAGDPHDYAFVPALRAYWDATCAALRGASAAGGLSSGGKLAVYGEGAAFTARFAAKALYEETLGRVATMVRGDTRSPLDTLSAEQEAGFASALAAGERWDHRAAADALIAARGNSPRDWERMIALNAEYRLRGFFRGVVRLPALPPAPATLRAVVTGLDAEALAAIATVTVVGPRSAGFQIETAAGAAALAPLTAIARAGGTITDIAGGDRVLLLVAAPESADLGALIRVPGPQDDAAQVLELPVTELAPTLVRLAEGPARAERLLGH